MGGDCVRAHVGVSNGGMGLEGGLEKRVALKGVCL